MSTKSTDQMAGGGKSPSDLGDKATRSMDTSGSGSVLEQKKTEERVIDKSKATEEGEKKKDPSLNITIDLDLAVKLKIELDLEVHGRVNIGLL